MLKWLRGKMGGRWPEIIQVTGMVIATVGVGVTFGAGPALLCAGLGLTAWGALQEAGRV